MKIVIRTLLCISIAVLGYFCVMSILTPIKFNEQSALREKAVVKNLIDLRKAQIEYKNQTGKYAVSADTLIKFIKNGQMPVVLKVGTLTDQQLNDGLTEAKAIAIVRKGNQKDSMIKIVTSPVKGKREKEEIIVTIYPAKGIK